MRVLVVGSGAREHTIAWMFAKSKRISGLFLAPGNAGTEDLGENLHNVSSDDIQGILDACTEHKINHVFVGPEVPLAAGLIDELKKAGIPAIGPHREAARLESSKVFSKQFVLRHGIPTADSQEFSDIKDFDKYIKSGSGKRVIKKNGLASGKGVLESEENDTLLKFGKNILKDDTLLVEEYLDGWEISVFTFTDGNHYLMLPACADFKKAGEGDTGPNTGGMGSICPVPFVTSALKEQIETTIVKPTFEGIAAEGLSFKGVLYFGLMITASGPKLLEYNVRLGDPETQVLLPLIQSDFGNLSDAIVQGTLDTFPLRVSDNTAVGVVIASGGYPGRYEKMIPVELPESMNNDTYTFHASTIKKNNKIYTNGGRCFTVVGIDEDIITAYNKAYEGVPNISFKNGWYRLDIGKKFFYDSPQE